MTQTMAEDQAPANGCCDDGCCATGNGFIPCDNHNPVIEVDEDGEFEACGWCCNTGRVTCPCQC